MSAWHSICQLVPKAMGSYSLLKKKLGFQAGLLR